MNTIQITTARQWLPLFGLGLVLAVTIIALVAVVLPAAAVAMAMALALAGAALLSQQLRALGRSARATVAGTQDAEAVGQPPMLLELDNGALLSARPVPLPGSAEHTLVLTREGYLLLDDAGRVIHRL